MRHVPSPGRPGRVLSTLGSEPWAEIEQRRWFKTSLAVLSWRNLQLYAAQVTKPTARLLIPKKPVCQHVTKAFAHSVPNAKSDPETA